MKIGILYICTGKYSIFWQQFYQSSEENLLIQHQKFYFVFTDDPSILSTERVKVFYKKAMGFPLDSLLRFEMFSNITDEISDFDYLYFFNSNMNIAKPIGNEIFPSDSQNGLVGVRHPGYFSVRKFWLPFEKRSKSTAYIKNHSNRNLVYFMGSFNGGKTDNFLKLIKTCKEQINIDLDNNIIAEYHDESHLNKYFNQFEILILDPGYAYPEGSKLPFHNMITIVDKVKHGGKYFDKLPERAYFDRLNRKIKLLLHSLIWVLKDPF